MGKKWILILGVLLSLGLTVLGADTPLYLNPNATPEQRTEDLLARMTLREKLGQITQIEIHRLMKGFWSKGPLDPEWLQKVLVDYGVGSVLSGGDGAPKVNTPEEWAAMTNEVQKWALQSRLKIPVLYGVDAVHGHNNVIGATIYPYNIGLGATFNPELIKRYAELTAAEIAATGIQWTFAPVLDVAVDPRWGRTLETFGEDPYLVSVLGVSQILGFEGSGRVIACGKHFTGYSAPKNGRDRHPAEISMREYYQIHFPPYRAAIKAGMGSVMINSGAVNGVPAHASKWLQTDILRNEMGFKGLIVSDWEDIGRMVTAHRYAASVEDALALAYNAGLDLNMVPMEVKTVDQLEYLVNEGRIPMVRIDDAVRHVLMAKFRVGLFENPMVDPKVASEIVGSDESKAVARKLAQQSIVLLRNEKNLLPLSKNLKNIVVAGASADSLPRLCSGWTIHWQGAQEGELEGKTVLEAIKEKAPGAKVTYLADARNKDRLVKAAKSADAVVVVIGEKTYAEGEGDSPALRMEAVDENLVKTLQEAKIPFVLVGAAGRPLILPGGPEAAPAILWAFLPGTEGGPAIADVLFGDYNPAGRLPITFPKNAEQVPMVYHSAKVYEPSFAFGDGLSYTQFEVSGLRTDPKVKLGQNVQVSVEIKNVGKRAGDYVALLFLQDEEASVPVLKKQLQGFVRVSLNAGEAKKVFFELTPEQLSLWDNNYKLLQEPGGYTVTVGQQSARFTVEK